MHAEFSSSSLWQWCNYVSAYKGARYPSIHMVGYTEELHAMQRNNAGYLSKRGLGNVQVKRKKMVEISLKMKGF